MISSITSLMTLITLFIASATALSLPPVTVDAVVKLPAAFLISMTSSLSRPSRAMRASSLVLIFWLLVKERISSTVWSGLLTE